jgi:hypothetical protein
MYLKLTKMIPQLIKNLKCPNKKPQPLIGHKIKLLQKIGLQALANELPQTAEDL